MGAVCVPLAVPLRLMTLDLDEAGACARLPVAADPGALACTRPEEQACFVFGGYTTGGVAEIMLIDAPVARTQIDVVP